MRRVLRSSAFSLWQRFPVKLRQKAAHAVFQSLKPRLADLDRSALAGSDIPVIIAGFLSSPSGLGQSARLTAKALQLEGRKVYGIDLSRYFFEVADSVAHGLVDGRGVTGRAHLIININAPYLPYALYLLGRSFLKDKYITGYWAWELPRLPASWKRGFACVHDIAVPSSFVADAVKSFGMDKPVRVAPHPAMLDCPLLSLVLSTGREAHAPFTVINSMSVSSGFERKNPLALIAAFRKAFGNASDCRLKMLISNAQHHAPARPAIEQALVGADNIEITWHGLDRQALWAWWRDADLYASLHRSEGFGLPLAEAMCAGTPVMATGWSGNMEFMSAKNSFLVDYKLIGVKDAQAKYVSGEEQWADPDIDHAAKILRQLKNQPDLLVETARIASEQAQTTLSSSRFCAGLMDIPQG